jgi:hypothetical protein
MFSNTRVRDAWDKGRLLLKLVAYYSIFVEKSCQAYSLTQIPCSLLKWGFLSWNLLRFAPGSPSPNPSRRRKGTRNPFPLAEEGTEGRIFTNLFVRETQCAAL